MRNGAAMDNGRSFLNHTSVILTGRPFDAIVGHNDMSFVLAVCNQPSGLAQFGWFFYAKTVTIHQKSGFLLKRIAYQRVKKPDFSKGKTIYKDGVPMSTDKLTVGDDMVVSMDYTLTLDSGEVIDSSEGREPLEFLHGRGQIISGLEKELYGMTVGDVKKVAVAPDEGYGEMDDDAFQLYPRDAFPEDMELTEGMGLHMRDTESGQVIEAYIYEIHPDGVVLDFNHPLAGETLHFDVKIAGVRPATSEELAHGHAHGAGHAH